MVESMVVRAQADQVPGFGDAVVFPVDDVVHFEEVAGVAAGYGAAAVAVFDDPSGAVGHDVLAAADRDRHTVVEQHRGDAAVAGDVLADGVGEREPGPVGGRPLVDRFMLIRHRLRRDGLATASRDRLAISRIASIQLTSVWPPWNRCIAGFFGASAR